MTDLDKHIELTREFIAESNARQFGQIFAKGGEVSAPLIAETEKKYGIPTGLLYKVAETESSFRPDVINGTTKSRVGAQGMFQFMPKTSKELGVNPLDINSATDGAARYLRQLYKETGSWDNAVMAYNMGATGLKKAQKGLRSMPKETIDYHQKVMGGHYSNPNFLSFELDTEEVYDRKIAQQKQDEWYEEMMAYDWNEQNYPTEEQSVVDETPIEQVSIDETNDDTQDNNTGDVKETNPIFVQERDPLEEMRKLLNLT